MKEDKWLSLEIKPQRRVGSGFSETKEKDNVLWEILRILVSLWREGRGSGS